MKRQRRFTIFHGFAVSIAVHAALGLPFVMSVIAAPPEEPPPLLIDLQGIVSETPDLQTLKESELDLKRGEPQQPKPDSPNPVKETAPQQTAPSDEPPMEVAAVEEALHNPAQPPPTPPTPAVKAPPPAPEKVAAPDDDNVKGAEEYVPPSMKIAQPEVPDTTYDAQLMKKLRVVYPENARRARLEGVATVSFTIQSSGEIAPDTLKIVKSSGHALLDAGALNTIRTSAPFAPPPREMTITIDIAFGPKR